MSVMTDDLATTVLGHKALKGSKCLDVGLNFLVIGTRHTQDFLLMTKGMDDDLSL